MNEEVKHYDTNNTEQAIEYLKALALNAPANGLTIGQAAQQVSTIENAYQTILKACSLKQES